MGLLPIDGAARGVVSELPPTTFTLDGSIPNASAAMSCILVKLRATSTAPTRTWTLPSSSIGTGGGDGLAADRRGCPRSGIGASADDFYFRWIDPKRLGGDELHTREAEGDIHRADQNLDVAILVDRHRWGRWACCRSTGLPEEWYRSFRRRLLL